MNECLSWKRARSDDQIEQRELTILSAAAELFNEHPYQDITFAMIGKQAKFTRSNLYRYFQSKEEVFLRLLENDLHDWQQAGSETALDESTNAGNFIQRWLPLVLENKRLLKLNEILTNVLEMNVTDEVLRQFKGQMGVMMNTLVNDLVKGGLFKSPDGAYKFLISHISLVGGMSSKMEMPERHRQIMDELNMAPPEGFYQSLLTESVETLYRQFSSEA